MRWRRGSLLSVLFAPLALLGAVAPVRGTQNDGECPLKSLVWTTAPKVRGAARSAREVASSEQPAAVCGQCAPQDNCLVCFSGSCAAEKPQ